MKAKMVNNMLGDLLTLDQTCESLNLGKYTVRRLAAECGAVRKIGRSYRIKKAVLMDYIDKEYAE